MTTNGGLSHSPVDKFRKRGRVDLASLFCMSVLNSWNKGISATLSLMCRVRQTGPFTWSLRAACRSSPCESANSTARPRNDFEEDQ